MESTSLKPTTSTRDNAAAEHARRSLEEARASAAELAAQGSAAVQRGAARARESIRHRADQTAHYVQEQPLKALLMAAAAGATIALVAGALSRHHRHHEPY